jgi:hypothetical protein
MAGKAKTVRVQATRNLDLMNAGETVELERDDRIDALLESGHLVEVDEQGRAADGSMPSAMVDPRAAAPDAEGGAEGGNPPAAPRARR